MKAAAWESHRAHVKRHALAPLLPAPVRLGCPLPPALQEASSSQRAQKSINRKMSFRDKASKMIITQNLQRSGPWYEPQSWRTGRIWNISDDCLVVDLEIKIKRSQRNGLHGQRRGSCFTDVCVISGQRRTIEGGNGFVEANRCRFNHGAPRHEGNKEAQTPNSTNLRQT